MAATALLVFGRAIQQQNVIGRHYTAAVITSLGIGIAQITLWRLVPSADVLEIIATLAGGPCGIVAAMWAHPRIVQKWSRNA